MLKSFISIDVFLSFNMMLLNDIFYKITRYHSINDKFVYFYEYFLTNTRVNGFRCMESKNLPLFLYCKRFPVSPKNVIINYTKINQRKLVTGDLCRLKSLTTMMMGCFWPFSFHAAAVSSLTDILSHNSTGNVLFSRLNSNKKDRKHAIIIYT